MVYFDTLALRASSQFRANECQFNCRGQVDYSRRRDKTLCSAISFQEALSTSVTKDKELPLQ